MELLTIKCQNYGTAEDNKANIRSALARGLPEVIPALCAHDGTFVVAASGPSLPDHIEELRSEVASGRPVCAVNGAYDFLVEAGVTPSLALTVDPRPMPQNFKNPQAETVFLLASRVNPELFDRLKGHRVMLWHSFGSMEEAEAWNGKPSIGGGSTSGMRAITIGYIMGYRKFVLYGMDSCLADDRKTKRFTGEEAGSTFEVQVGTNGRRFWCNGAMAQQANEFQDLFASLEGIQVEAKGAGLIAEILKKRKLLHAKPEPEFHSLWRPGDGELSLSGHDPGEGIARLGQ
jgi:uncharacterized Rossmann fold enzyme